MDKVLNIGDEVLVFRYIREWGINQDEFREENRHSIPKSN